jgi:aminopeptidase N
VLHNWWGNGVYVDWQRGNWSEGLTTFMADYAYKEGEGEAAAREMRLGWLRDFAAVPPGRDRPLREFTSRTHDASQIVGYNKAAFVFFMLRDEISADAFAASLRRFYAAKKFQAASWADLEHAFSAQSGQDLQPFFAQWLDRAGAPRLHVDDARAEQAGNGWRIRLTLSQGEPAYRLRVPLEVQTERGTEEHVARIDRARQDIVIETQARPRTLSVDPGLHVFRRLDSRELPAILRQVTLDPATATVIVSRSPEPQAAAQTLAQRLMDTGPRFADALPAQGCAIVIGLQEDIDAWLARAGLPPEPAALRGRGTAQVWTAQSVDGRTLLVVSARDAASLQSLARPLPHYGRQSWLVFDGAKAIDRGVWEAKALSWRFE